MTILVLQSLPNNYLYNRRLYSFINYLIVAISITCEKHGGLLARVRPLRKLSFDI
jgi:hypothetical protein